VRLSWLSLSTASSGRSEPRKIAPHEVLEAQGLQVLLVDTRQLAQVPGRDKESNPTDCQ